MALQGKSTDCHAKSLALIALTLTAASGLASPAQAVQVQNGFAGPYAPPNWSLSTNEGNGNVDISGAPSSIVLTGSNSATGSTIYTNYTITALASGPVRFDWFYNSTDASGYDGFGYLLNGAFTFLTEEPGSSGSSQLFNVMAGDAFGFRVFTQDDGGGPGVATISNFSAPVPGPLPILGVGAAIGWSRRLRRRVGLGTGCGNPDRRQA